MDWQVIEIVFLVFFSGILGGFISGLFDAPWERINISENGKYPDCSQNSKKDDETNNSSGKPPGSRENEQTIEYRHTIEKVKIKLKIWPYRTAECATLFPGLVLNMFLGGIAAVVFWSLYGPFSGATVIGTSPFCGNAKPFLTIGELASSLLIGMGGAGFLMAEASRRCSVDQLIKKIREEKISRRENLESGLDH